MKKSNRGIRRTVKLFTFVLTLILLASSMPFTLQAMAIETMVNESGKYYYRTLVTYMTPEKTYGTFCSFYEL